MSDNINAKAIEDSELPPIEEVQSEAKVQSSEAPIHKEEELASTSEKNEPDELPSDVEESSEEAVKNVLRGSLKLNPENQNVSLPQKVLVESAYKREGNIANGPTLAMPSDFDTVIAERIIKAPNISVDGSEKGVEWAEALNAGQSYVPRGEFFRELLEDPSNEFTNRLRNGSDALFSGFPPSMTKESRELKGEAAVSRVLTSIGAGRRHQTALYNSGFYVTFKPGSETAKLELNRLLLSDDIRLGRRSYGLLTSSLTGVTAERLIEIATEHIYETSVVRSDLPFEKVPEHVLSQDLPSFLWGFLTACYPEGFNFERACTASPGKCDAIEKAILNLSKLQWPRSSAFKSESLMHMARRRPGSMTMAQIKHYQNSINTELQRSFTVKTLTDENVTFFLRDCTLTDYIDNTHEWIQGIEALAIRALGTEADPGKRNSLMAEHAQASLMRQYGHWVDRIEISSDINPDIVETIADRDSLGAALASYSSDKEVRETFVKSMKKYITASTMAVIGIPAYDCVVCNGGNEVETPVSDFKNIIPLDVIQVFFELLSQMKMDVTSR